MEGLGLSGRRKKYVMRIKASLWCFHIPKAVGETRTRRYLVSSAARCVSRKTLGNRREEGRVLHPLPVSFGDLELSLFVEPLLVEGTASAKWSAQRGGG